MFRVWRGIKTFQSTERGISDQATKIQINDWLVEFELIKRHEGLT